MSLSMLLLLSRILSEFLVLIVILLFWEREWKCHWPSPVNLQLKWWLLIKGTLHLYAVKSGAHTT